MPYLPSQAELNKLYLSRTTIGGFASDHYWSSSEYNATVAWDQYFVLGDQGSHNKVATSSVRAVRAFVAPAVIGQSYGGGKVAYILQTGDPGYVAGQTHGLIVATADQGGGAGIMWAIAARQATSVPGGTGTAIGAGSANTTSIITQNGAGITYAAGLARACTDGGYSDWYLPSKDELSKLYLNRVVIGGSASADYWSSSEFDASRALLQVFNDGFQHDVDKGAARRVRAVRAF